MIRILIENNVRDQKAIPVSKPTLVMKSFPNVITARPFSHHAYQENLQYFSKVKTSVNGLLARIIHLKLPLLHWLLIETLIRYYSPGGMIHCSPRRLKRKKHYINRYSLQVLIFLFIVFGYFVIFPRLHLYM